MTSRRDRKLRILHVARAYDGIGGVERHVRDLVEHQRTAGHQSDALVVGSHGGLRVRVSLRQGICIFLTPKLFNYQSAVASLRFPDTLARLIRRYDVVHFHYPNPIGEVSSLMVGALARVPMIATFHGEVVPTKRLSSVYDRMAHLFFKRVDRIIVTSPGMLATAHLIRRFLHKTTVVPLGIVIPEELKLESSRLFPRRDGLKLLFVGRLTRYKGVHYLIEAIATVPGHLVIVGQGPLRSELEAQTARLGLSSRITFSGAVPDEELYKLYRSADLLVLPSIDRAEGFGYVLLEAMAASLPMITTELGTGTSYVNLHEKTGLVVSPGDANALATAIKKISEDQHTMEQFGQAARSRLLELFTFEDMAARIEEEYRRLIAK